LSEDDPALLTADVDQSGGATNGGMEKDDDDEALIDLSEVKAEL